MAINTGTSAPTTPLTIFADRTAEEPQQRVVADPGHKPLGRRDLPIYLTLFALSALFSFPFLWLVLTSLKPPDEVFSPGLIPDPFYPKNYADVFRYAPVGQWLWNTAVVSVLAVVTVVFSSALIAYGFARLRFKGRTQLFALVIATYMLPGAVTLVPTFLIWRELGAVGTTFPLWASNIFGSAFYIFMLRQFLFTIPQDLVDAARVDGASYFGIWWKIMLPLVRPALVAVAVFEFQAKWNDFMTPLIYLNSPSQYTMSLGLGMFKSDYDTQWALWMAASVVFTLPMVLLFFVAQRFFIEGVATTGLKG
ncbi:MAG: carbohydrate ABC transporter permease [Chloroflexota bacterium]|nr:carbohydrate ABC transporter permease [Chloroflexota bacterium]MDQ3512648.1 carbohydrate ABC transporter permease [Chloroflexota bacterium]